jgi:hypothetical protein
MQSSYAGKCPFLHCKICTIPVPHLMQTGICSLHFLASLRAKASAYFSCMCAAAAAAAAQQSKDAGTAIPAAGSSMKAVAIGQQRRTTQTVPAGRGAGANALAAATMRRRSTVDAVVVTRRNARRSTMADGQVK